LSVFIARINTKRKEEILTMTDPQALLRDFERQLADVSQERERLEERESALRQTIAGLRRIVHLNGSPVSVPDTSEVAPDAFKGMPIKQAAIAYLRLVGQPQTNRQIVTALQHGGIKSESKRFAKTVRSILLRDLEGNNPVLSWDAPHWSLRDWEVLPLSPNG
jgi:hypothetical protein